MYRKYFKRVIDFILSFVGLVLLSPILIGVTIWLSIANKGSAFFFQERPGMDEKIFKLIKFKSMTDEKDSLGNLLPDAERLTNVGRFVRSTSLDEIPQLINVLKGDMSLIGPRPLLVRYLEYYTERERLRHTVRPGITGLSQVSGRNALDWGTKFELDVRYVENISFIGDLSILWTTVFKVLKREGTIADKKENYFDIERKNKITK